MSIVKNRHESIAEYMLVNPTASLREVAMQFDMTTCYLSTLMNSDTFKELLGQRKLALVNPVITSTLNAKMAGLCDASLDKLASMLDEETCTPDTALDIASLTSKHLAGYQHHGGEKAGPPSDHLTVIANFVQAPVQATGNTYEVASNEN